MHQSHSIHDVFHSTFIQLKTICGYRTRNGKALDHDNIFHTHDKGPSIAGRELKEEEKM
jgi:hypothetical protein